MSAKRSPTVKRVMLIEELVDGGYNLTAAVGTVEERVREAQPGRRGVGLLGGFHLSAGLIGEE